MLGKVPRAIAWPKAVDSGADLYLVKPVSHVELVARMKAILRRREWALGKDSLSEEKGGIERWK